MNMSFVKKTQTSLGRVIKKPTLTEKLLCKPPFRFLHDIFTEVIRTTGFMEGLYGENEMKSDNVKDRDSKIAFLQKAIDVVMLVSGEPLVVNPSRIVAGLQPERTNELLQAIAKCCHKKLSSDKAVKRVLAGEKVDSKSTGSNSRSQDKDNSTGCERNHNREVRITTTEGRDSRAQNDPERPKERESCCRDRDTEHCYDPEPSRKTHGSEREQEEGKDKEKGKEERIRAGQEDRGMEREQDRRRRRDQEGERRRENQERENVRDGSSSSSSSKIRQSEETLDKLNPTETPVPQSARPANSPQPSCATAQRSAPAPKTGVEDNTSNNTITHTRNGCPSQPRSARPAPPQVKKQEPSSSERTPAERLSSTEPLTNIIMDGEKFPQDEEGEDEQFVVEEAVRPPARLPQNVFQSPGWELPGEERHGGLVSKILKTKMDYESQCSSKPPNPVHDDKYLVCEAVQRKERDMDTQDIRRICSSVQSVCGNALRLARIIDYMQEDMDAMKAELRAWRQENKQNREALLEEQRAIKLALNPLRNELLNLEQMINEQQDRIFAKKYNNLQNEERIQKMLTGNKGAPKN